MAPIRLGDGTGIDSVRLGDGTEIDEVRTGDGQTVFSAGPDIPDSAINQYKLDEGSGTTAVDFIGNNNLAISGASWYSDSDLVGGAGLDFDGSNDEAVGDYIPGIGGESAFSIGFTLDLDKTGDRNADGTKTQIIQNMKNSDRDDSIGMSFGNDDSIVGDVEVDLRDGSGVRVDESGLDISGESGLVRIVYTWDGNSTANFYLDTSEDRTFIGGPAANSSGVSGGSMTLGSTDGGEYGDIALDNVVFYDQDLSASEVQQDFDAQPWS